MQMICIWMKCLRQKFQSFGFLSPPPPPPPPALDIHFNLVSTKKVFLFFVFSTLMFFLSFHSRFSAPPFPLLPTTCNLLLLQKFWIVDSRRVLTSRKKKLCINVCARERRELGNEDEFACHFSEMFISHRMFSLSIDFLLLLTLLSQHSSQFDSPFNGNFFSAFFRS